MARIRSEKLLLSSRKGNNHLSFRSKLPPLSVASRWTRRQEPGLASTQPEALQSPSELESGQALSNTPIVEELFPTLQPPTTNHSSVGAAKLEVVASTSKIENTMAQESFTNGEKSQEEQSSTSVDHDMTDAYTHCTKIFPLTENCHHYTRRSDVDWDIQK